MPIHICYNYYLIPHNVVFLLLLLGIGLKIESVVFVYELINYLFMKLFFLLLGYVIINALTTH